MVSCKVPSTTKAAPVNRAAIGGMKKNLSRTVRFETVAQVRLLEKIAEKKKQSGNKAILTLIDNEAKKLKLC